MALSYDISDRYKCQRDQVKGLMTTEDFLIKTPRDISCYEEFYLKNSDHFD